MLGRSHQEKKDGRFWTDPVLKEAYLRLQTGSGKPRLEFVSDLLGNFFSSRECKHHKKKKSFSCLTAECWWTCTWSAHNSRFAESATILGSQHMLYTLDLPEAKDRLQPKYMSSRRHSSETQLWVRTNSKMSQNIFKGMKPCIWQLLSTKQKSLWYCLYPWFDLLWAKCLCCSKSHMLKS